MTEKVASCPFTGAVLPGDGTPLKPSPTIASWREQAPAVALQYEDGHEGLVATEYNLARAILEDARFSVMPMRMPLGPTHQLSADGTPPEPNHGSEIVAPLDADGELSEKSNLLALDGAEHSKLRRIVSPRFSVKQVRGRREWIANMVAEQLELFKKKGPSADIWNDYAKPIAARTHCSVIGIPDSKYEEFVKLFAESSTAQQKYDFIREVLDMKRSDPGEDSISDLLSSTEITRNDVEGLTRLLLSAGRDSVAYMIATAVVALLTNPDQLKKLQDNPEMVDPAIEEFMRYGSMFLTVFPRTALEDIELEGVLIKAGQSVSVSPVGANRDPGRWESPDEFDVSRDAFGHLGFSHGIHGCIGQQLARIEIGEAIKQLLQGCPGLRLVEAEQLEPLPFAHPVAVYEAGHVLVDWN
jgi:cytochrome P450